MNRHRLFQWNENRPDPRGRYVLYWMQIQRRLEYNFALEHAVEWANTLNLPLLIYEGLSCDYPWACDRLHTFILQGMKEMQEECRLYHWNYYPYVEARKGEGAGLMRTLVKSAAVVVTDHFPTFVIRAHNESVGPKLSVPYISVDSGCIIPLGLSEKAPYSAYHFRRLMQKHFVEAFSDGPKKKPLNGLKNRSRIELSQVLQKWPRAELENVPALVQSLPLDHSVPATGIQGTRKAALLRLRSFVRKDLSDYDKLGNHPDLNKTSGLAPYLHFGKISSHEIISAVFSQQPHGWTTQRIRFNRGSREGFFRGYSCVDAFLDQLVTWRETGYHFCQHVPGHDRYESLPDWSRKTLEKHAADLREFVYSLAEFERAATHDPLWNAAQNQLLREGIIHNYLRMLWGKKILEWSPDPRLALDVMIHLNNKYALDGRNPNSYSGIFWILGRFDRPWAPEREVYGFVRTMSSRNTARKVRVKKYLQKYS